jgi:gliding motility-associated-like protein
MFQKIVLLFFVASLCLSHNLFAQGENNRWCFGPGLSLNFNTATPTPGTSNTVTDEGACSVSDASGNLLFYSDGHNVFNSTGTVMPNGAGIMGNQGGSSTQGVMIVRSMSNSAQYFLFVLDATGNAGDLRYSMVDMTLNGGQGDVIAGQKNILVGSGFGERQAVAAGQSCNAWFIAHRISPSAFYAYEITAAGLNTTPVISPSLTSTTSPGMGEMKISHDNQTIIVTDQQVASIGNFNNATGVVSGMQAIPPLTFSFAAEFSPDNSKVYVSESACVSQFDVTLLPNMAAFAASRVVVHSAPSMAGMRMGPDNKIYVLKGQFSNTMYLARINQPNLAGTLCDYDPMAVTYTLAGTFSGWTIGSNPFIAMPSDTTYNSMKDTIVCMVNDVTLTAELGYDNYVWSNGATGQSATFNNTGKYCVFKSNTGECDIYVDSFNVILAKEILNIGKDTLICEGDNLVIGHEIPGATYTWQDGSHDAYFNATGKGTYIVVTDLHGCKQSDTIRIDYRLNSVHIRQPDTAICDGRSLIIVATGLPGNELTWNTGATGGRIEVNTAGKYVVKSTNICNSVFDSVQLKLKDCNCKPLIPNAFTPNNDGNNDEFVPQIVCDIVRYNLKVFNRYGQKIYESFNKGDNWDGSFNSSPADAGTYFYVIQVTGPEQREYEYKGDITLLR